MAQSELVRVVAYLDASLAERLASAAASDDRSVSKEVARRLEASFGERPAGAKERERREKAWGEEYAALAEPEPRVPPETPEAAAKKQAPVAQRYSEPLALAVNATGVKPASQVCARERFHRPGVFCKACGKSF